MCITNLFIVLAELCSVVQIDHSFFPGLLLVKSLGLFPVTGYCDQAVTNISLKDFIFFQLVSEKYQKMK